MKTLLAIICALCLSSIVLSEEPAKFVQEPEIYSWRAFGLLYNDADTPGQPKLYQYYERRVYVEVPSQNAVRGWYGEMVMQEKKQMDINTYEEKIYWREFYPTPKSKRSGL